MQSQDKKIKRLIDSKDEQNNKLGQLALVSILNKDNVLYWYMELDVKKGNMKFDESLDKKVYELLGWPLVKPAMESLEKMVNFIQINCPSQKSIERFFTFYNNYLFSLMSHNWTTEQRKSVKSQIPQLNVSRPATESYEDL